MKNMKQSLKRMFGGRFRAGSYSAFAAVIVIIIAVVVNMMAASLPATTTQLDLTNQSLYSLSEQTKRITSSLEQDVNLYLICNDGNEDPTIQRLMERYESLSGHIKAQSVDPTLQPTFLDRYELELTQLYENSVLVESGSKYRLVGYDEIYVTEYEMDYYSYNYTTTTSFSGENALTNAIHYVSSATLPKVYTLSGHGEMELNESIQNMLVQDNFETESLSLLTLEAIPEDATAIIINAPTSDLAQEEADLLIAYLENGGNVALMTGYMEADAMPQLKRVAASMGLAAEEGLIIEGNRQMHLNRYPYYLLPDMASHEVTDALISGRYYVLAPLAQPLTETEDSSASITWLLTTSDSAYTKQDGLETTNTEQEDGDAVGTFNVGALAEATGKFFWVTSDTLLQNNIDLTVSGANSNLFLNVLNWMGGQEESISIRAKSLDAEGLTVTQSSSSLWSIIMIGVIPLSLIGIGIAVWVRRKRK